MSEQTTVVAPELEKMAKAANDSTQIKSGVTQVANEQKNNQTQQVQDVEKLSATKPAPIYFNGKKFETQAELLSYTSQLETAVQTYQSQRVTQETQQKPTKKVSDLLFEDPDAAVELIKNDLSQEFEKKTKIQKAEQENWQKFFNQFPDLKEEKDLVDFVMQRHWNELSKLHADQAITQLGEKTRETIGRYKAKPSGGQELPSGPVVTGPNGTKQAPKVETEHKVVNFVDQIRSLQTKKKIS